MVKSGISTFGHYKFQINLDNMAVILKSDPCATIGKDHLMIADRLR